MPVGAEAPKPPLAKLKSCKGDLASETAAK
jgi:hypothetical protein